jgi:hypothetical protein
MKGSFGLNRLVKKAQGLERKLEFDIVKTGTTKHRDLQEQMSWVHREAGYAD